MMIVIGNLLSKLQNVKTWVDHSIKTSLGSQDVKWPETLGKSAWEKFYQIFLIIRRENELENVSLVDLLNLSGVS